MILFREIRLDSIHSVKIKNKPFLFEINCYHNRRQNLKKNKIFNYKYKQLNEFKI